ncbi:hypothetical protein CY34DRAFT_12341 [Suillus luteus UH-Slu-Lm8-n1]|uniref:Uncharacterized protein n=1 Tax=Suillus luteus UH-Slu-Lm8-n1 TaxID=930992 RepID=A0A0C9ZXQ6_9AGAM|nr:hypothetical protein CY34DRAFT_12341 [Suillus luteus UH-Slu-Lm8-n1]
MPLAYEILHEIFNFVYIDSNPLTFMALLELNKAYSDIALTILGVQWMDDGTIVCSTFLQHQN